MRASKKGKSLVGPHCALLLSIQPERLRPDKRGRFRPPKSARECARIFCPWCAHAGVVASTLGTQTKKITH